MGTIIQYKNLVLVIITIGLFTSCKKQDLPAKPQPSAFSTTMENNSTNFTAVGGTSNIIVTGGTNGWWVTMPVNNWCVITKLYGSGDFKIPVTIKPNTSGVAREINVVIHPTFGLEAVTINLKQSN